MEQAVAEKVAELLAEEAERIRLQEEAIAKAKYDKEVLYRAYDVIRCSHIDDALERRNLADAFDLIFTPSAVYSRGTQGGLIRTLHWHYSSNVKSVCYSKTAIIIQFRKRLIDDVSNGRSPLYTPVSNDFSKLYEALDTSDDSGIKERLDKLIKIITRT